MCLPSPCAVLCCVMNTVVERSQSSGKICDSQWAQCGHAIVSVRPCLALRSERSRALDAFPDHI